MVRFEANKFIIEVEGCGNPVEHWSEIVVELIDVLGALEKEMIDVEGIRFTTQLLKEMMPEWEVINKMGIKKD